MTIHMGTRNAFFTESLFRAALAVKASMMYITHQIYDCCKHGISVCPKLEIFNNREKNMKNIQF